MAEVDILYINLEKAVERRQSIEESFKKSQFSPAWTLNRFNAVNALSGQIQTRTGPDGPTLKAAWLSHLGCVKTAIERGLTSHLLVAEDDTEFCHATEQYVTALLRHLNPADWDIIYLDAFIPNAVDMPWFFKLRHKWLREGGLQLINLHGFNRAFAGAGSYIVNNASLKKLVELIDIPYFPGPIDLVLRNFVLNGLLKGILVFPFLTTVAAVAETSQVQYEDERIIQDRIINNFRRLVWIGAEPPSTEIDENNPKLTKEILAFQAIFTSLLAEQMDWF